VFAVFNPLSASEITLGVGQVLKQAASAEDPQDDYQRSQLLSAYSITRHLAAEQAAGDALLVWFRERLSAELREASAANPPPLADLEARAELIGACRDSTELGRQVSELLLALRQPGNEAPPLIEAVHRLLRDLCDREVAALAGPSS
jgi:hypothetical protein